MPPYEPEPDWAAIGVVDSPESPEFDKFVDLVRSVTGAAVALVSIVEPAKDRQFFAAQLGLPPDVAAARQTPLSHSFCRHVRMSGKTLEVADSRLHPLVAGNPAIETLGILAYLGAPIPGPDGRAIGALCAIEREPRVWRPWERAAMEAATHCVGDLVRLRVALAAAEQARRVAEAAEAAQDRLLTRVSHELRTPLNGVLGVAALLEPMIDREDKRRLLTMIRDSGDRLLRLTEDILDWSNLGRDGPRLAEAPVDFAALAEEAATLHAAIAAAKGLTLTVDLSPERPAARMGDRARILQILNNLIGNAVKFTERGGVALRISAADGEPVVFEVEDSGHGVSPKTTEHAFDEFWRGEGPGAGFGLGLAIVRGLARAMGGEAELGPAPGGGALARAVLPLARA